MSDYAAVTIAEAIKFLGRCIVRAAVIWKIPGTDYTSWIK